MKHATHALALLASLSACAGSTTHAYVPAALSQAQPPGFAALQPHGGVRAQRIYFAARDASAHPFGLSEIGVFAAVANGNTAPINTIKGSNTQIFNPQTAILDKSGKLWTCDFNSGNILAFAPGANANATPIVNIAGSLSQMSDCGGIVLSASGMIYAASFPAYNSDVPLVAAWKPGSNGNVAPAFTIAGSNTKLVRPWGLALDNQGELYVSANFNTIVVFGAQSGNATPLRTISGTNTKLSDPYAIAIDPTTQRLIVANAYANSIAFFAFDAHGNVAPTVTIAGNKTGINGPYGVAVDKAGYVYVGNCPQHDTNPVGSIEVFAPGSNGNVAPVQRIIGPNASLTCVNGLTVQ